MTGQRWSFGGVDLSTATHALERVAADWPAALLELADADDADPAALADNPREIIDGGPWRGPDLASWAARFRRAGDPVACLGDCAMHHACGCSAAGIARRHPRGGVDRLVRA